MKVMLREVWKTIPGKRAERDENLKKEMAALNRMGENPVLKRYVPFAREGDRMHTLVSEVEFESLAALEAAWEKGFANPEMLKILAKWEEIYESHVMELYMVED